MSDLIPTNTLRDIYARPAPNTTNATGLDDLSSQRSQNTGPDPNEPGHHTKTDFVLGRSAIIAILCVTIVIIVLIIVVVVKAGQIAKKNAREKKAKQAADKAAGIVSGAMRSYAAGAGMTSVLWAVIAQILLL